MVLLITVSVILICVGIVGYLVDRKRKRKVREHYIPYIYPNQAAEVLREAGIFVVDDDLPLMGGGIIIDTVDMDHGYFEA